MNVETGFELDDLRGVIRRRAKVALVLAGAVTLAAYWIAMALPNEYESYATVLVEPQAISPDLVQAGVRDSDLTARLHIMTAQILSRSRLSRIIDDVELYEEEQQTMLREQIIDLMRDRIRVEPVIPELRQAAPGQRRDETINQFRIYFTDQDPRIARVVAQRLANDFIERHIQQRVDTSQKSVEFVEAELERLARSIESVEAKVAAVKAANPGRLPENLGANQTQLHRVATELAAAQRALAIAQSDEAFYRSQVAAASSFGGGNDDNPAQRLEGLELLLSDYQARGYTDKHPDVVKARIEIASIRQRLKDLEARGEAAAFESPSFAKQSAEAEAHRAALRVGSATEEVARAKEQLEEVQKLVAETPAVAEQLDGLQREYQHLFRSYQDFSKRRLEATVQAQLERRQLGEQFRVLEAAFQAPEPSSPNRPLIVIIGLLFGLVLAGGVAVVLEGTDPSVHSARQLQQQMSLPVLATIPKIWLESDSAALRRHRVRQTLATVAVVAFALMGGFANYAWVNGVDFLRGDEKAAEQPQPEAEGPAAAAAGREG